jgi:hypothetical protein
MASTRQKRFAQQVAAMVEAKYGPQVRALATLLSEARSDRDAAIDSARGIGRSVEYSARAAMPQVAQSYQGAITATRDSQASLPAVDVNGAAGAIGAASARDFASSQRRLAAEMQSTQAELVQRQQDAQSGVAAGIRQARAAYSRDAGKIRAQLAGLAGDQGAYEGDRDRRSTSNNNIRTNAQSERNSQRSSGIDPDTGQPIPGGKLDPKPKAGKRRLPGGATVVGRSEHGTAQDSIAAALDGARRLKGGGAGRATVVEQLRSGVPMQTVTNADGSKTKVPGIKAQKDLWTRVAADLVFNGGYVSADTRKRLHARGYSLKQLGLKTAPRSISRPPVAPGPNGQLRPT